MTTQNTTTTNGNNDATATRYMSSVARGILMAADGEKKQKVGTALACVGMVMLLKERSKDHEAFNNMVRHVKGGHVDGKKEKEAFDASWNYWLDTLRESNMNKKATIGFTTVERTEAEQERDKHLDLALKQANKAPLQSQVRTLRFACSVAYAFINAKVTWDNVTCPAAMDALYVDLANMRRLNPKAEYDGVHDVTQIIQTYGVSRSRFTTLAKIGNDELVKAQIRKAPPKPKDKTIPMRDAAKSLEKEIVAADEKALDNTTQLNLYSLLLSITHRLNGPDVLKNRLPNNIAAPYVEYATKVIEAELNKADAANRKPIDATGIVDPGKAQAA